MSDQIDAQKLREILDRRDSQPSGDDYDHEMYVALRALLQPTMDRIHWKDAKHFLVEAKYQEGQKVQHVVMLAEETNSFGDPNGYIWCSTPDGTGTQLLPSYGLTPTDRRYRLEPVDKPTKDTSEKPSPHIGEAWIVECQNTPYAALLVELSGDGKHWVFYDSCIPGTRTIGVATGAVLPIRRLVDPLERNN